MYTIREKSPFWPKKGYLMSRDVYSFYSKNVITLNARWYIFNDPLNSSGSFICFNIFDRMKYFLWTYKDDIVDWDIVTNVKRNVWNVSVPLGAVSP